MFLTADWIKKSTSIAIFDYNILITSPVWSPNDAHCPVILRFASRYHSFFLELKTQNTNTSILSHKFAASILWAKELWNYVWPRMPDLYATFVLMPRVTSHVQPLYNLVQSLSNDMWHNTCNLCANLVQSVKPRVTSCVQPRASYVQPCTLVP